MRKLHKYIHNSPWSTTIVYRSSFLNINCSYYYEDALLGINSLGLKNNFNIYLKLSVPKFKKDHFRPTFSFKQSARSCMYAFISWKNLYCDSTLGPPISRSSKADVQLSNLESISSSSNLCVRWTETKESSLKKSETLFQMLNWQQSIRLSFSLFSEVAQFPTDKWLYPEESY